MSNMSAVKLFVIFFICTGHVTWAQTTYRLCVPTDKSALCESLHRGDSEVSCILVADSTDCALKMKRGEVDFGLFETEQAMVAVNHLQGEDFMVVGEVRQDGNKYEEFAFTSVVVARRSSVSSGELWRHKDLKLCHPGVGRTHSGWSDRVLKALDDKMLDTIKDARKCDEWRSTLGNEINAVDKIWGRSCRPGRWSLDDETDKRLKEDHESLCELCPDRAACSYGVLESNPHEGAAECLRNGGDVAFMEQMYAKTFIQSGATANAGEWTLVCRDLSFGNNISTCNWDRQSWPPVVARREISTKLSAKLNEWLKTTYPRSKRDLLEPKRDLLDPVPTPKNDSGAVIPPEQPREMGVPVPPQPRESQSTPTPRRAGEAAWITALKEILLDTYEVYETARPLVNLRTSLGRGRDVSINFEEETAKSCRGALRWCSTQSEERAKCEWLSYAALVAGVVPPIKCLGAETGLACARLVHEHKADVVVTNIDEAHRAQSELKMEVNKFMESSSSRHRSVVVVVPANSELKNISEMEGKKACFPVMEGIAFGAFLRESMSTKSLPDTCPYGVAVGDYLGDSCIPGANKEDENPDGLCALCKAGVITGGIDPGSWNKPPNKCAAHNGNVHYGDGGALRCLHSGEGEVAWLELQGARDAIQKQIIPKMKEDDFKVLCKSGHTIGLNAAESCSLATVPTGAAIIRYKDTLESNRDVHNTLTQIDRLFGLLDVKHPAPSFHMYRAFNGTRGLIFPEGTVGMLDRTSKIPSVDAYIGLTELVPRPCGEGDYNAAMSTSVSVKLFIAILALKTFLL